MIIPTVFVKKSEDLKERFELVSSIAKHIHIDFMDGIQVPTTSHSVEDLPDLKELKEHVFEAHLMVRFPQNWVPKLEEKGFQKVIFHLESVPSYVDAKYVAALIRRHQMEPILAINPETNVEDALLVDTVKKFQIMGVVPGKEAQSLAAGTFEKIKKLKEKGFFVQVDGGVNEKDAPTLAEAGADALCAGSYIAAAEDPKAAYKQLEDAYNQQKWKSANSMKLQEE